MNENFEGLDEQQSGTVRRLAADDGRRYNKDEYYVKSDEAFQGVPFAEFMVAWFHYEKLTKPDPEHTTPPTQQSEQLTRVRREAENPTTYFLKENTKGKKEQDPST